MSEITIRPAGAGDKSEIVNVVGGTTAWEVMSDSDDDTYGQVSSDDPAGLSSLFILAAHGLPVGTVINSVKLYYRGCIFNSGVAFTGLYKRDSDANETADADRSDASWTTYYLVIPVPAGGWTLDELTNLQIGARLKGNDLPHFGRMADVWVLVDYTLPAIVKDNVLFYGSNI